MSYQLYRNTTLGNTLQESIDEMIQVTYCRWCWFVFHILIGQTQWLTSFTTRTITGLFTSRIFFCFVKQFGQITPALGMKILLQFDKAVNNSLATRVKSKITFKVNNLCQIYCKYHQLIQLH